MSDNPIRILLVEDNPGDARLIIEYLPRSGDEKFNVIVAARLDTGSGLLHEHPFDVVLLDLTLPDSNGLATFERIHRQNPAVPVIVLTGLDDKTVGVAAVKAGAQDYLLKWEVNQSVLVRTIRHSIERAALESQILQSNRTLEERVKLRTQELEASRERATRSEKLALIGQLSGGIGHDLRNPLNTIKNAAELVTRKINAGPSIENSAVVADCLELIDSETTRANDVITNLLSHGSNRQLTLSNLQIGDVIQDTLDRFVLNENIVLSITVDSDLPSVSGDGPQITRVLQNLLANAQDAMKTGGSLSITAQQTDRVIEIVISDTGTGISPENIDRVFEPLFSDKPRGTGLGLAICRDIIENHRGSISVDSNVGSGTSFTIQIPIPDP